MTKEAQAPRGADVGLGAEAHAVRGGGGSPLHGGAPPALRIGQGFDVHPFSDDPTRPLVLGGVVVPGGPGLSGHSDADAVAHALADALLGAAGLGDLGRHFPDTDPAFAGADSLRLLADVVRRTTDEGWRALNADLTVVAERPRLSPYTDTMAEQLGSVLGAPVNVKATRAEGLGSIGRAEGIACLAVVLMAGSVTGSPSAAPSASEGT